MPSIEFKNINLGGLSDTKYQGTENSMYRLVGLDLHSEPGIIQAQQKLTKDSGSTVDDLAKSMVSCSDGNTYLFGSTNGKIWKRTSGGVYTLEATNANGGTINAIEFNGYIYYFTNTKVGRWEIGSAWSTRNDSYATFTNGDATYHPACVLNLKLYIGDKNYVAQISESHTFTANALDLESNQRISCLGGWRNQLLIGTFISSNQAKSRLFRWTTWSDSWSDDDEVPEVGVNAILPLDNTVVVQCGVKGNLYYYDGSALQPFKKVPGVWSSDKRAITHLNATALFPTQSGVSLFAVSNQNNNPCLQGVYSLGGYASNYPKVLSLDYVISERSGGNFVTSSIEIGAILIIGDDMLVSWENGSSYGVDKLDWSNKLSGAYLETLVVNYNRGQLKNGVVEIFYRDLPANCNITLQASINDAAYTNITLTQDTARKRFFTKESLPPANSLQYKVILTCSGNDSPTLESILLTFQ